MVSTPNHTTNPKRQVIGGPFPAVHARNSFLLAASLWLGHPLFPGSSLRQKSPGSWALAFSGPRGSTGTWGGRLALIQAVCLLVVKLAPSKLVQSSPRSLEDFFHCMFRVHFQGDFGKAESLMFRPLHGAPSEQRAQVFPWP